MNTELDLAGGVDGRVWPVGALCRAVADALEARFNPVRVSGELGGFTRASSGHCYFVIKDAAGQLRCAMFRRAAVGLDFSPRDGELVELRGRLGVYEPRGELQLVVESMTRAGRGTLFEQFLETKARLQAEGLLDAQRKRSPSPVPRGIGLVTSLGAAALHDVVTTLQRRVPHLPVVLAPTLVQGEGAPRELCQALERLYVMAQQPAAGQPTIDTILLVRGGGSLEDLWAFNDETLARTIARSPVPLISGVGHETDFTIADFVADVRAPTPTAAAELVSASTEGLLQLLQTQQARLQTSLERYADRQAQMLDRWAARMGRPSALAQRAKANLAQRAQTLAHTLGRAWQHHHTSLAQHAQRLAPSVQANTASRQAQLAVLAIRLQALNPQRVLQRGYAWLADAQGAPLSSVAQLAPQQTIQATLADGTVDLTVLQTHTH